MICVTSEKTILIDVMESGTIAEDATSVWFAVVSAAADATDVTTKQ
ncbi:hypothetical protein [Bacillus sp. 1P06AnD]